MESYYFTLVFLKMHFIFTRLCGKDSDRYSVIQGFLNKFKIIALNWIRISKNSSGKLIAIVFYVSDVKDHLLSSPLSYL